MASESSCTIRLCHVAVVSYEPACDRSANTSSTAPVHARVTVRRSAPQQAKAPRKIGARAIVVPLAKSAFGSNLTPVETKKNGTKAP